MLSRFNSLINNLSVLFIFISVSSVMIHSVSRIV